MRITKTARVGWAKSPARATLRVHGVRAILPTRRRMDPRVGKGAGGTVRVDRALARLCPPYTNSRRGIAEAREVRPLLVGARRQLEQAGGGAAKDVVLGLFRQERQVPDAAGQVEVPVRIVRRIKQLSVGVDHLERACERAQVLGLHRL